METRASLKKAEKGDGMSTCILARFPCAAVVRLSSHLNFYCASCNLQQLVSCNHDRSHYDCHYYFHLEWGGLFPLSKHLLCLGTNVGNRGCRNAEIYATVEITPPWKLRLKYILNRGISRWAELSLLCINHPPHWSRAISLHSILVYFSFLTLIVMKPSFGASFKK